MGISHGAVLFLRVKESHAKKKICRIRGSSLTKNSIYLLFYTANAATTRNKRSGSESVGHGSLSAYERSLLTIGDGYAANAA